MERALIGAQVLQFALIYLLLVIVLVIMHRYRIDKTRMLLIASLKMTVQLILAGLVLTYIFVHPHPLLTLAYLACMTAFTIHRVLSQNRMLDRRFKRIIALSIIGACAFVLIYFVCAVIGEDLANPQYAVPLAGMIMGNTMTGVSLGLKAFRESLHGQHARLQALLCAGAAPREILLPFARQALESGMLPTLNSMLGMGIVFLPGMMTGQILAGALPMTAILYQIAVMIAICTAVTCACFGALIFGSRTLIDEKTQTIRPLEDPLT